MIIDSIILSKAADLERYGLTGRTINSLKNSEEWSGNVIVVESVNELDFKQLGFVYHDCSVIHPEEKFNYNRFLNIGIAQSKADWILICNNDLFFTKSWLKSMKDVLLKNPEILSASPISPNWHLHSSLPQEGIIYGYTVANQVCGWCILMHRSLIDTCKLFDEQFEFWYQDNDYAMSLECNNIKHALICDSKVYHMTNASHDLLENRHDATYGQSEKFYNKWKRHS